MEEANSSCGQIACGAVKYQKKIKNGPTRIGRPRLSWLELCSRTRRTQTHNRATHAFLSVGCRRIEKKEKHKKTERVREDCSVCRMTKDHKGSIFSSWTLSALRTEQGHAAALPDIG